MANLVGEKFGKLEVKYRVKGKTDKLKNRYWFCVCECDGTKIAKTSELRRGTVKSCGCLMGGHIIDLRGQQFGYLIVKEIVERPKNIKTGTFWKCLCECGNSIIVRSETLKRDNKKHCGCKGRSRESAAINNICSDYRSGAKRRELPFSLTIEDVSELIKSHCFYCNSPPDKIYKTQNKDKTHKFYHNGIDRIQNDLGYFRENCVPCCKNCNIAKRDHILEEFLILIESVYNHFILKIKSEQVSGKGFNINKLYYTYRKCCERINRFFNLSKEEFSELVIQPCYYCGIEPKQKHKKYLYNGIDRIDSKIGYITSNCVPCCKNCNYMKSALELDEFKTLVTKIYNRIGEIRKCQKSILAQT